MKLIRSKNSRLFAYIRGCLIFAASSVVLANSALAEPAIKNIVLVHGAFVDGSGWQPVYDILVKDGYSVTVVQDPLTSLEDDVAATKRILDRQPGQCLLVGHRDGGAVITAAGTDPHVAALVYIAAHAPAEGETEAANGKKKFPNASKPLVKTQDGFVFSDPETSRQTSPPTCRASRPSSWRTRRCSLRLRCSRRPLPTPPGN